MCLKETRRAPYKERRERPKPVCLPERDVVSSSGLSISENAEALRKGGADILINRSLKRKKKKKNVTSLRVLLRLL